MGRVHHAGDTVWFPSPELLGHLALCRPHSWVAICAASICSLDWRGSAGQSAAQTQSLLGLWAVSRACVDELELAGGQLAELAASPVDTTGMGGETLGVVSGTGPGLGNGTHDRASQAFCPSRPLVIFRSMSRSCPALTACLSFSRGPGLCARRRLKQLGVCV